MKKRRFAKPCAYNRMILMIFVQMCYGLPKIRYNSGGSGYVPAAAFSELPDCGLRLFHRTMIFVVLPLPRRMSTCPGEGLSTGIPNRL